MPRLDKEIILRTKMFKNAFRFWRKTFGPPAFDLSDTLPTKHKFRQLKYYGSLWLAFFATNFSRASCVSILT
jgi:hypothetical protein